MIDNEEIWLNYEIEETEAEIDVADMVIEELALESILALIKIEMKGVREHMLVVNRIACT